MKLKQCHKLPDKFNKLLTASIKLEYIEKPDSFSKVILRL